MNPFNNLYFKSHTKAAPLAVFRILFGVMMFLSLLRFWAKGWIEQLYIQPRFFFSYYGFEWVKPLGNWTYLLFAVCALSALFVALGYKYRPAIILFFLSFTYIELMDKTTYLNHYYFNSLLSFLMIFLPANVYFSLDARRKGSFKKIPRWTVDSIKLLLAIVYFYAGLAKLNSDWLFEAMPLKIWLSTQYHLPVIGTYLSQEWAHYLLSWGGAVYDLAIPFLLLYRRTRPFAFLAVVVFHILTRIFFPIGMFPYIMILSALIFFDSSFHEMIINQLKRIFKLNENKQKLIEFWSYRPAIRSLVLSVLTVFFIVQLLLPWRYLLYPGELFWTEEGYRFSWRVMLMEKTADTQFKIVDGETGKRFYVNNSDFLSPLQQKEMAGQPDFILEYAHYLGKHFTAQGHRNLEVYVESYATLNGRRSRLFINPKVNLLNYHESFRSKDWILPLDDEIEGL